jgi:hypothetical protein
MYEFGSPLSMLMEDNVVSKKIPSIFEFAPL